MKICLKMKEIIMEKSLMKQDSASYTRNQHVKPGGTE